MLLLCGEKNSAGLAKSYNKRWSKTDNIPLVWVHNVEHNLNTDNISFVNNKIIGFVLCLKLLISKNVCPSLF